MILIFLFVITEMLMQFLRESLKKEKKTDVKVNFVDVDLLQNAQ